MKNIFVRSGDIFTVDENDLNDLLCLVREELSPEVAEAVQAHFAAKASEVQEYKESLSLEMEACEDEAAEVRSALEHTADCIEELMNDIQGHPMGMEQIVERLGDIKRQACRTFC